MQAFAHLAFNVRFTDAPYKWMFFAIGSDVANSLRSCFTVALQVRACIPAESCHRICLIVAGLFLFLSLLLFGVQAAVGL